jgi:hypothetical protein
MSNAEQIADAEARTRRADATALDAQIRLCIVREKLSAMETAENKRQRIFVQTAVEKLVTAGAIHANDHAAQFDLTAQFLSDPALIPLALTKRIYRAQPAVNRR